MSTATTKITRRTKIRLPSPSAFEDAWQRRATAVAIEKARALVAGGALKPLTPIGRLADHEWGWIVCNVLFGWIHVRAEQATSNGAGSDQYIRNTAIDPDPWLAGAVAAVLPELADVCKEVDWSLSLNDLTREEMTSFLVDAFTLISKAVVARDKGERIVTRRPPDNTAEGAQAEFDWDTGDNLGRLEGADIA
jgi:hypothetical protein